MNITITGASGFVGQNLANYLRDRHYEVRGLSLRSNTWLSHIGGDTDAIIHLAGKAHDTSNTSGEEEYFRINRDLTIQIFDYFLKSEIRDFFYFSSVKAVADTIHNTLTEDVEPKPHTPYGKSKLEAEKYILSQTVPSGKRVFIIRPCMIHGPGNKGNLNLLYKMVEKGIPWPLAEFENQRSFLSIENLSFLLFNMLKKENLESGIFNFSDDDSLSTNELVSLIGAVLGKSVSLWKIPRTLVQGVVRVGDVLPLPLNSERLKKLTESYVVSNKKIKEALGMDHLPISAIEGLKRTIKSFKQSS